MSRFLVSIEAAGLPLTLALNKADLVGDDEVAARIEQCARWGYRAVAISCEDGRGLGELGAVLAGKTSVVAGPSGAGKSSLINALRLGRHKAEGAAAAAPWGGGYGGSSGWQEDVENIQWAAGGEEDGEYEEGEECEEGEEEDEEDEEEAAARERAQSGAAASSSSSSGGGAPQPGDFLVVGDVSKIGRGKHTTRVVRLIPLPGGGLMADTPGFGLPTLDGVASSGLAELFPEFRAARRAAGGGCRFVDCMHVAEPGCAVSGEGLERYAHYLKFLAEVKVRGLGGLEGGVSVTVLPDVPAARPTQRTPKSLRSPTRQTREDYDVRVMQLAKRQREGAVKLKTGRGGAARYEARLESKKHRATSRRKAKQAVLREEEEEAGGGDDGGGGRF